MPMGTEELLLTRRASGCHKSMNGTLHSGLKMYSVDFFGNAEAIEIPKDAVQLIGKKI